MSGSHVEQQHDPWSTAEWARALVALAAADAIRMRCAGRLFALRVGGSIASSTISSSSGERVVTHAGSFEFNFDCLMWARACGQCHTNMSCGSGVLGSIYICSFLICPTRLAGLRRCMHMCSVARK